MRHALRRRLGLRSLLVLGVCLGAAPAPTAPPPGPAPQASAPPVHGLVGHFYTRDLPGSYDLRGFLVDDYGIPAGNKAPNATRVDPQIAFGAGKGFARDDSKGIKQLVWWTPPAAGAVVWNGFVRLPKAGTYYFTTASSGASAVYIGGARVCVNGGFGGHVPTDLFTLADAAAPKSYSSKHQHVVPVLAEGRRDLPIEVRYRVQDSADGARGIDLYWVTPDGPRGADGKPVAQVVPAEALYTRAPGPIDKPRSRGANGTVTTDYLYIPAVPGSEAAVTVRLADEKGRPVAGHRVHLTAVQDDGGITADEIVQPVRPTDANGVATATFRHRSGSAHTSRIIATDITDMVDVAQEAHVIAERKEAWNFLPRMSAQYYDPKAFRVEPLPMRVGQPLKVSVTLTNRTRFPAPYPAEVTATFYASELNIGAVAWGKTGAVERVVLQPGESREVSVNWTPTESLGHVCFRVDVSHKRVAAAKPAAAAPAALTPLVATAGLLAADVAAAIESIQQNVGPVVPDRRRTPSAGTPPYQKRTPTPIDTTPAAGGGGGGRAQPPPAGGKLPTIKPNPKESEKEYAARVGPLYRLKADQLHEAAMESPEGPGKQELLYQFKFYDSLATQYGALAVDPPQEMYRQLAAARSATAADYLDAVRESWERYQGAEAAGDTAWMAKQYTASRLYMRRAGEALKQAADQQRKTAAALPPDSDAAGNAPTRGGFVQRLRSGGMSADDRLALERAGIPPAVSDAANARILARPAGPAAPLKSLRALLTEGAALCDASGDEALQVAAASPADEYGTDVAGTLSQEYVVGNPRNEPALVDLFVRRISIPADWKLSVVTAPSPPGAPAAAPGAAPGAPQKSAPPAVSEFRAGLHYKVSLPAKGQVRVLSVVTPNGPMGDNTTARWAVEGRIGNELLGGLVHEMHVPAVMADLELPPVGSATASAVSAATASPAAAAAVQPPAAAAAPAPAGVPWMAWAAAAATAAAVLIIVLVLARRRRRVER